jgi:hypothetical protein
MSGYCKNCGNQICNCDEKEKPNELYLRCGCGCEVLHIERDVELNISYLSIYTLPDTFPWMHKLRHIWKIIKTGTPYTDQITLCEEDIRDIRKFLDEKSDIPKDQKDRKGKC